MGELNYNLIVLIAVVGTAFGFMLIYAVGRLFINFDEDRAPTISNEQLEYMAEVRHRNLMALEWVARAHK